MPRPKKIPGRRAPVHGDGITGRGVRDRLTTEQRLRIVQLLGEFYPPQRICRMLSEEFGIAPPHETLIQFYKHSVKWRPARDKARDALAARIRDIAIANKVHRIRVLESELAIARHWRLTGETKTGQPILRRDTGAIERFLRLAAEEMGELKQVVEVGPQEHVFRIIESPPEPKK